MKAEKKALVQGEIEKASDISQKALPATTWIFRAERKMSICRQ